MQVVKPHPQFASLTEAEVEEAVVHSTEDPDNPIAVEALRLLRAYMETFRGNFSQANLLKFLNNRPKMPDTPIEHLVLCLMVETLMVGYGLRVPPWLRPTKGKFRDKKETCHLHGKMAPFFRAIWHLFLT